APLSGLRQALPDPRHRADDLREPEPIVGACAAGAISGGGGHPAQRAGKCEESHFVRAAFTARGFSWAIQWPDRTTTSVRFRQSCRIGSARREVMVSHV